MSENIRNEFEVLVNNVRQNIITRGNKVILPSTELTDMPSSYENGSILTSGSSSYSLSTPVSLGMMAPIEIVGATNAVANKHFKAVVIVKCRAFKQVKYKIYKV